MAIDDKNEMLNDSNSDDKSLEQKYEGYYNNIAPEENKPEISENIEPGIKDNIETKVNLHNFSPEENSGNRNIPLDQDKLNRNLDQENNGSEINPEENPDSIYSANNNDSSESNQYDNNEYNNQFKDEETDSTDTSNYNFETSQSNAEETTNSTFNPSQDFWKTQNFTNDANGMNMNNYYRESYKKAPKKSETWKYILVSLVSSIVGGAILTVMLLVVAPSVQPGLKGIISGVYPNYKTDNTTNQGTGELKRVEIVQNESSVVTSVAEKVGPSVVGIKTSYQNTNEIFGTQSEGGEGSGIIISTDGYILTNHHVIEGAINDKTRTVRSDATIEVYLSTRIDKPYKAIVKGYDSKTDLAVLKIEASNLPAVEFGDSDKLKVGEAAIAIGNPGGLEYMGSVTQGVISGLNRTVQLDNGKRIKLIQTDAAINPGNSGGALVNIKGQLIGINSVKMVATGFEGLGFSIPVNTAKTIADELISKTYIAKPYLGISVDGRYNEEVAKANNMPVGIYVADVELLGSAEKAGIRAGDVITKFNNKAVTTYDQLEEEKNKFKPGNIVPVEIYRDGATKTVSVTLGETK